MTSKDELVDELMARADKIEKDNPYSHNRMIITLFLKGWPQKDIAKDIINKFKGGE